MWNKSSIIKYFLIAFIPLSVLIGVGFAYAFNRQVEADRRVGTERSAQLVNLGSERVEVMLAQVHTDLEFIRSSHHVAEAIQGSETARDEVTELLLRLSAAQVSYSRLRILDQSGIELVLVNREGGVPVKTPEEELVDEGDRYYFQESIETPAAETYVSRFDLNVENGVIEEPRRPMIRFGRAVHLDGGVIGAVILNFNGQEILDYVASLQGGKGSVLLVDHEGYYLRGPDRGSEWGFMPGNGSPSFLVDRPDVWMEMNGSESGVVEDSAGLTAYDTIRIGDDELKLIYILSSDDLWVDEQQLIIPFSVLYLGIIVILGVGSVTFARLAERRSEAGEIIRHMAQHDQLTDLPNRTLMSDRLDQALAQARRHEKSVGVIYFDLDGFKQVNDTLGHSAGDELLIQVAGRVAQLIRETDTLARVGGDEFVLVQTDLDDKSGAEILAKKITQEMSIPFTLDSNQVSVSCSIGIALYPEDDSGAEKLVSHADQAMYKSKHSGKGIYTFHGS